MLDLNIINKEDNFKEILNCLVHLVSQNCRPSF